MNATSVYYNYRNPTENFFKFSPYFMYPCHSQTVMMDVMVVLFIEFPDLQFHYDLMFDSLYITSSCHFHLYFFAYRGFAVPHFHPLFDLAAPYIAILSSGSPSNTPSHTTTSIRLTTSGAPFPLPR